MSVTYIWPGGDWTEQDEEGLSERKDEEQCHGKDLEESGDDLLKHDDVDSKPRLEAQEEHKVEPAKEDAESTQLPPPANQAGEVAVAHEGDGGEVEKDLCVVQDVREVDSRVRYHLDQLR